MACGRACTRSCMSCGGKHKFCSAACQDLVHNEHKALCYNVHSTLFDAEDVADELHDVLLDMTEPDNHHIVGLYSSDDAARVQELHRFFIGDIPGNGEDLADAAQEAHEWISEVTHANSVGPMLAAENFPLSTLVMLAKGRLDRDQAYAAQIAHDPMVEDKEVDAFYTHMDRCRDMLQNLEDEYHGDDPLYRDLDALHRDQIELLLSAPVARGARRRYRRKRRTKRRDRRRKKQGRREREAGKARREEKQFGKREQRQKVRAAKKEVEARKADRGAAKAKTGTGRRFRERRAERARKDRDTARGKAAESKRKKEKRGRRGARKEEGARRARRKADDDQAKLDRMDRKKEARALRKERGRPKNAPPVPSREGRRTLSDRIKTSAGRVRYSPMRAGYTPIPERAPTKRETYDVQEYEHDVDPDALYGGLLATAAAYPDDPDVAYYIQSFPDAQNPEFEEISNPAWCKEVAEFLIVGNAIYRARLVARLLVPGGRKKLLAKVQSGGYRTKKKGKSKLEDIKTVAEGMANRSRIAKRKAEWEELAEAAQTELDAM